MNSSRCLEKVKKDNALEKLRLIGQQHIFHDFEGLIQQVESINIPTFRLQQQMLLKHGHKAPGFLDVFEKITLSGDENIASIGQEQIKEGKVGCLIVAGGMGTRLQFNGPKGMYPISLINQKTLFQLVAEKTLAAGHQAGRDLSIAIMTSPLNHIETVRYFEENDYFGLHKDQIDFFSQEMLPLLDHSGNLFLDQIDHLAVGPDGNGGSLQQFVNVGIWKKWYENGIRYLNFTLIDNPLADPFDAELIGFHHFEGVDVVMKCTARQNPRENVGVLIEMEDKVHVIEYSELPEAERIATDEKGRLKHIAANLSLFSFSMDFIKQISKEPLPLHIAHKTVECLGVKPKALNAWKFEKFIFDVLPLAMSVRALLYPREACFAPLKNDVGDDSPATVRDALQKRDRAVFAELTGKEPPQRRFELDPAFYYPTDEMRVKWKGKELPPEEYITI